MLTETGGLIPGISSLSSFLSICRANISLVGEPQTDKTGWKCLWDQLSTSATVAPSVYDAVMTQTKLIGDLYPLTMFSGRYLFPLEYDTPGSSAGGFFLGMGDPTMPYRPGADWYAYSYDNTTGFHQRSSVPHGPSFISVAALAVFDLAGSSGVTVVRVVTTSNTYAAARADLVGTGGGLVEPTEDGDATQCVFPAIGSPVAVSTLWYSDMFAEAVVEVCAQMA